MSDFRQQLQAFIDGKLSRDHLLQQLSDATATNANVANIADVLKEAYRLGRLSQATYDELRQRLPAVQTDELTRLGRSGDDDDDATVTSTPVAPHDATEVIARPAPPTHAATEVIPRPAAAKAAATEVIERPAASDPSAAAPPTQNTSSTGLPSLDFELPSEVSAGTGSNWSRPDRWQESELGPIEPGTLIKKRFLIESQLGRGGMGVVFKARDLRKDEARDSDPFVAIKILSDEFRNHPHALISLQREASKAQKLAHPNVITVYDFDRDGTTVYMTMELMRGESLSERIRTSGWRGTKPSVAVPIIKQMAAGLAYAHEHGIVHSDFKPGNVFVTSKDRVKVIDFGIARAAKHSGVDRGEETVFDAGDLSALTPRYASYEMLIGEEPHPSDDVYGLAVTAYQLLTGDHPFGFKTAEEAMAGKLTPRPIKGLKRRQWKAIERALRFQRKQRTPDAGAFLKQFRGPTQIQKTLTGAIAALVLVAAFLGYRGTLEKPGPFPEELRATFDAHMKFGEEAFDLAIKENDLDLLGKAAESFDAAWDIHPKNPNATDWLQDSADRMLRLADERQLDIAVSNLLCKGDLATYRPVVRACDRLGEDRCAALKSRCLEFD